MLVRKTDNFEGTGSSSGGESGVGIYQAGKSLGVFMDSALVFEAGWCSGQENLL